MIEVHIIEEMIGKKMVKINNHEEDKLEFQDVEGNKYLFYHEQDCCESVYIEDIQGDLDDLIGEPILMAEEVVKEGEYDDESYESNTWTFYKFATIKGTVTVRWIGSSNGYYSESVDFRVFK